LSLKILMLYQIFDYGLQNYKEFRSPPNYFTFFLFCIAYFDGNGVQQGASQGLRMVVCYV